MRPVPQVAIDFVKREEACVLRVYDDARPNHILAPGDTALGTLTAGYGHTGGLSLGQDVTQAYADMWLEDDLAIAAGRLSGVIDEVVYSLTNNQYAALLSFVFNLGANPGWTIWKRLKAKEFDQVPLEMMKFVNAGGKKLDGLVKRRADEVVLWGTDEPGSASVTPPSSVTRKIATPPTSADPQPITKSRSILAAGGAAIASAPAAIKQVTDTITPYAAHSAWVQNALGYLAGLGAIFAIAAVVFMYLHKKKAQG